MPMPDPTGDTGHDRGFFNERRLMALLIALVLMLLAITAWLAFTVSSLKREREKPAAQLRFVAGAGCVAVMYRHNSPSRLIGSWPIGDNVSV